MSNSPIVAASALRSSARHSKAWCLCSLTPHRGSPHEVSKQNYRRRWNRCRRDRWPFTEEEQAAGVGPDLNARSLPAPPRVETRGGLIRVLTDDGSQDENSGAIRGRGVNHVNSGPPATRLRSRPSREVRAGQQDASSVTAPRLEVALANDTASPGSSPTPDQNTSDNAIRDSLLQRVDELTVQIAEKERQIAAIIDEVVTGPLSDVFNPYPPRSNRSIMIRMFKTAYLNKRWQ